MSHTHNTLAICCVPFRPYYKSPHLPQTTSATTKLGTINTVLADVG